MAQKGWTVDVNQCVGCRACENACKVEYDLQIGQGRRRRVIEREGVDQDSPFKFRAFFTSLACNQCVEPACLKACPVGAYIKYVHDDTPSETWHRDDQWLEDTYGVTVGSGKGARVKGVVMLDPGKCIGCRRCEWSCPYGAPQFNPDTKKIHKCEGCWQRVVDKDDKFHERRQVPACVDTCLGMSIFWDDVDPTADDVAAGVGDNAEWYDYQYGGPNASDGSAAKDGSGAAGSRQKFVAPGPIAVSNQSTGNGTNKPLVPAGNSGRGSSYVADWNLTKPALKIRNRVYQTRTGGWE